MYQTQRSKSAILVKEIRGVLTFSVILAESQYIAEGTPLTYNSEGKAIPYFDNAASEMEVVAVTGNMVAYESRDDPNFNDPQENRVTVTPQGTGVLLRCVAASILAVGDSIAPVSQDHANRGMLSVDTALLGESCGKIVKGSSLGGIVWVMWKNSV